MRDLLTYDECCELRRDYDAGKDFGTVLKAAARLGAERAMQAPDGDLPEMLADPALERLRDWYAIGPVQRAALDMLVAWVRERERERAARVCEAFAQDIGETRIEKLLDDCAAAIRRGEWEQA